VNAVFPGSIATVSIPNIRKNGHRRSINCDANNKVPSEVLGIAFFAAKPIPKCPMNKSFLLN